MSVKKITDVSGSWWLRHANLQLLRMQQLPKGAVIDDDRSVGADAIHWWTLKMSRVNKAVIAGSHPIYGSFLRLIDNVTAKNMRLGCRWVV
jgi:hypothetical protein